MNTRTFSESIKDFFFPKLCVSCRQTGTLLCENCWSGIKYIYEPICPVCHQPSIAGRTHAGCTTAWGLDGAVALCFYSGPIRPLVRQLKYQGATVTEQLIARLLQTYCDHESLYLPPAIITPIPLHRTARQLRGFNQAAIIAAVMASQTNYPMLPTILQRHQKTVSQTTLSKVERQSNIHNAFSLATTENIKGADFILVDDVFTTGATMREAAKVLKRSGAKSVYGFALARD